MTAPQLPSDFIDAITRQLGTEAAEFLASYDHPATYGLRVNPAKSSLEQLRRMTGWVLEPIPWCPTGAYVDPAVRAGSHPYHAAGLYYLQEPTAMVVVEAARIQPGDAVLDLAAAPGGKTTQAAGAVGLEGLLIANEIHPARIKALGENLERWGSVSAVLTNATPERLREVGPVLDRVIVDAHARARGCSGGILRAGSEWSPARVAGSADRQREIRGRDRAGAAGRSSCLQHLHLQRARKQRGSRMAALRAARLAAGRATSALATPGARQGARGYPVVACGDRRRSAARRVGGDRSIHRPGRVASVRGGAVTRSA